MMAVTKRDGIVRHFARNYIIEQLELNDYGSLAERLRMQCVSSINCCDDEDAEEILHKIAQQLTTERGEHFERLCVNLELRADNVSAVYNRVVQEMFATDVHWGSVVTLVSFTGVLVVYLARHGLDQQVPHTLEQMDTIIHEKVLPWITLKGGWVSADSLLVFIASLHCSQPCGNILIKKSSNHLHWCLE